MSKTFISLLALVCAAVFVSCEEKKEPELALTWASMNVRLDTPADSMKNWMYRRDTMANFIKAQDLDIVGMQEVLYNQLTDLSERLPEYSHVGVGREDGATQGEHMCIFFKKDKFDVLDSNTFWLSQYPDSIGFVGWDGACPRVATWAKLKDKETGKVFMAVNTHFDHIGVEARHNGALLIMERIKDIVGDQPAVLTGDF
ncbi:MAG: endonuclease/exonuclease/phosphatase family protein, partial [Bacteroidaceae bacterium]|nr:endonuclease/exonuclease/phosphatase family protein [Bacteroidaceae bacterium]